MAEKKKEGTGVNPSTLIQDDSLHSATRNREINEKLTLQQYSALSTVHQRLTAWRDNATFMRQRCNPSDEHKWQNEYANYNSLCVVLEAAFPLLSETPASLTDIGSNSQPVGPVERYDYDNQAWTVDWHYMRCNHPDSMDCQCFGKIHAGEFAADFKTRTLQHKP